MRLFIAIPLPEDVKDYLILIQKEFSAFDLKFVKREQMHLTIDFLGETLDNRVESLIGRLDEIRSPKFKMNLTNLGAFPSKQKIRVIWAGIESDNNFMKLQKDIRDISEHKDKLLPHLTLARSKKLYFDKELSKKISDTAIEKKEFEVSRFILYKSIPSMNGYAHEIVKEFSFENNI